MRGFVIPSFAIVLAVATLVAGGGISPPLPAQAGTGTIKGHIQLAGKLPGNLVIRMGKDPKCSDMNKGKQVVQEVVKATADGSLGNVFVRLEGTFPSAPVPKTSVVINQDGCVYQPRVAGVRVGQMLEIRNNDNLLHNLHSSSNRDNAFNVAQAKAGVVNSFKMKSEEVMLHLGCDVHSWMTAYIGVVTNPYFAVSDSAGTYVINNVPPGTYTIDTWHERYGPLKKTVKVAAGAAATVDFSYTGNEAKPSASNIEDSATRVSLAGQPL
jgi:plastocyanin